MQNSVKVLAIAIAIAVDVIIRAHLVMIKKEMF